MLYLIGLGLSWEDLSLKGLEAINKCAVIYLEGYTSVADFSVEKLSRLLGKKIIVLNRKQVEEDQPFFKDAHLKDVALLVYGDPLSATTHIELLLEAKKKKIETKIIHAQSILTVVAETGLFLYKFGKTASIPIPEKGFQPESFYDTLKENLSINAHTLFLLDLKPQENKFLTPAQALKLLLDIAKKRKDKIISETSFCIVCARLGSDTQLIKAGSVKELLKADFGNPLFCLIVPSKLHFKEKEALASFIRKQ